MLIGKGAGCFKSYFRKFLCLDNFFLSHIKGVSPRFLCNYLIFCLVLLAQITSRGMYLFAYWLEFLGLRALRYEARNFRISDKNGGHIGLLAQIWNMQMSYVTSRIVRESPKNVNSCSSGRAVITKTWKKLLKSSHRVNITVNLKTIHQYLCPVKFWWRSMQY